jgi:hypothetical protein
MAAAVGADLINKTEQRFRDAVLVRGGTVHEYRHSYPAPWAWVQCREGHESFPDVVQVAQGARFCDACTVDPEWFDAFYVVSRELDMAKFGITSTTRDGGRLWEHARVGLVNVHRFWTNLPGRTAIALEDDLKGRGDLPGLLAEQGYQSIQDREYYPLAALPAILAIVDQRLGDVMTTDPTVRQLIGRGQTVKNRQRLADAPTARAVHEDRERAARLRRGLDLRGRGVKAPQIRAETMTQGRSVR